MYIYTHLPTSTPGKRPERFRTIQNHWVFSYSLVSFSLSLSRPFHKLYNLYKLYVLSRVHVSTYLSVSRPVLLTLNLAGSVVFHPFVNDRIALLFTATLMIAKANPHTSRIPQYLLYKPSNY